MKKDRPQYRIASVSYTHLDVYKRQEYNDVNIKTYTSEFVMILFEASYFLFISFATFKNYDNHRPTVHLVV